MNNTNGWELLLCNFFYLVCLRVLAPYFSNLGFANHKTKINGIIFKKDDLFVEISYVPETAPKYSPSVIIGIGNNKYNDQGKKTGVPVWSLIPEARKARSYSFWKFSNEIELEDVLNKLKSEIIEQYLRPLWEDRVKLEKSIKNFGS